ncbi:Osmotin thaumatin-like protein [Ganoderma leucocontextum]|nr:Osmotin thaumatin-like protein [Ganoderma leucocontextum]
MKTLALIALVGYAVSTSALTIKFKQVHIHTCTAFYRRSTKGFTISTAKDAVWPAVGKASNGQPDPSVKFSKKLDPGQSASFGVDDHALVSPVADFGPYTAWDLSRVDASINIDTQLSSSDGQTVVCRASNCPANQAYNSPIDYAADRNSPLGQTFTHTFCP